MYKLLDYPEYIMYDNDVIKEKKSKWNEYFGNFNQIAVEIGTGSGNFMYQLAERNPNKNFIGLELRFKRLVLATQKCKKRNLKNVAFLRKRGEELEDFLADNEISEMYINFPDPWEGTEKAENNIKTEFEQLFLHKHNKNINYIEIKKIV